MKLTTKKIKQLIMEELNEMALSDEEMKQRIQKMRWASDNIDVSMHADSGDEDQYARYLLDQAIEFFDKTLGDDQELTSEIAEQVDELYQKAREVLGYE